MFVKTTKGIYEVKGKGTYYSGRPFYITTAEVILDDYFIVKESDNLNDLIEIQYQTDDKKGWVCNVVNTDVITDEDRKLLIADTKDRIVGLIRVGDDLVKVADWDNEKGEWKLYER